MRLWNWHGCRSWTGWVVMAILTVDSVRRHALMRAHSATHILHYALQQHIPETSQAWSLVEADMLRFDFTTKEPLTTEQLQACEDLVNERIRNAYPISTQELSKDKAIAQWAKAFFEDKYGATVRMVTMHDSKELCWWTHCSSTTQIGAFMIDSQEAVASWVRRITAYTWPRVARYWRDAYTRLQSIAWMLWSTPKHIEQTITKLTTELEQTSSSLHSAQQLVANSTLAKILTWYSPDQWVLHIQTHLYPAFEQLTIKQLAQFLQQTATEQEFSYPWLLTDSSSWAFVYADPAWNARERLTTNGLRWWGSPKQVQWKSDRYVLTN